MGEHEKGIKKLLERRLRNSFIDVIFLPNDDLAPHTDYLKYDPEITYYTGYVVATERVQIPFIAEVWPDGTVHIYLNPGKNFYLAHLVGEIDG